jgi:glycosyltransferase involved in cell wall biosynthesis
VSTTATGARPSLTVIVLTLDEARHLPDCLASLAWAQRILVFDSGSQDDTVALARAAGAQVQVHPFENYSRQRQAALDHAESEWVLFVDADERVTPELADQVQRAVDQDVHDAYWLPRRNLFWGNALRGGGWWPDHQLRLLRVSACRYDPARAVHELAEVQGSTARLTAPLSHINYESAEEFRLKQRTYALMEAQRRASQFGRPRTRSLILQPLREFRRRFVQLGGWRDGRLGLWLCAMMAASEWRTLREQIRIAQRVVD